MSSDPTVTDPNPTEEPCDDESCRERITRLMGRTIIDLALIDHMKDKSHNAGIDVIVDLNLIFHAGRKAARDRARKAIDAAMAAVPGRGDHWGVDVEKSRYNDQYLFAYLSRADIERLADSLSDRLRGSKGRPIYKLWLDFEVEPQLTESVRTIKADAARAAFAAGGEWMVWAVIDSGIDGTHSHFQTHGNLDLESMQPVRHMDFTSRPVQPVDTPIDPLGHGTHVAGIIGGQSPPETTTHAVRRQLDKKGKEAYHRYALHDGISGVAPQCKLVSLRVLAPGHSKVSSIIAALGYVHETNGHGSMPLIHGVNISIGYRFDPEWFACGNSPLCNAVDRLVRSGVVVVVAAGNTGHGKIEPTKRGPKTAGYDMTINDPGNAKRAITVGATHRERPHEYGVSYFSSKGPTSDGRLKPDLVAPGERVLSCAAGARQSKIEKEVADRFDYVSESGTSMAAPHVSGAIAAFLSIRREFIGKPDRVKEIFLSTATDLGREAYFQGRGLVDLMRAIQSV